MAAKTSAATGNWSSGGTWTGGVAPVPGDTVTIASPHQVTITTAVDIGSSPAAGDGGTAAILVNSGGKLIISGSGADLTLRGDLRLNTTVCDITGAGRITFDATSASSPSTTRYRIKVGTVSAQATVRLNITGTDQDTSPFRIRSNTTGGAACGYITTHNGSGGPRIDLQYVLLEDVGDSSTGCIVGNDNSVGGLIFRVRDCTFRRCGRLHFTTSQTNALCDCQRVEFIDTTHATHSALVSFGLTYSGSNARRFLKCSFDKRWENSGYSTQLAFDGNYLPPGGYVNGNAGGGLLSFAGNLVQDNATSNFIAHTESENCVILYNDTIGWHGPTVNGPTTIDGCILQGLARDFGESDVIYGGSSAPASTTATITNNILLPNPDGSALGVMGSLLGNANHTWTVEHNTCIGGITAGDNSGGPGFRTGETYVGKTGQYASFKSNLAVSLTSDKVAVLLQSISDKDITGITQANPAVVTSNGHGLSNGSLIRIINVVGMTEVNDRIFTVAGVTANTFQLSGENSTGHTAYSSGGEFGIIDPVLPANCTHNFGWRLDTGGQGGSGNPGFRQFHDNGPFSDGTFNANGGESDPEFVQCTSSDWPDIVTFDTDYLGTAAATAWVTSTGYVVGDIRSDSQTNIFGGKTVNYRCILAHTSGSASRPITGGDWNDYWEPASLYRIRSNVVRATYDGVTPKATIEDFRQWVRGRVAPTCTIPYEGGAHDGGTPGAVPGVFEEEYLAEAGGTSTATAVGASLVEATGSASGIAAVAGVGVTLISEPGAAAGTSAVAGVGMALAAGLAAAAGTSAVAGTGASLAAAVGSASGETFADAVAEGGFLVVAEAGGTSTVAATAVAVWLVVGSATGTSAADAVGSEAGEPFPVGMAAGTSTVLGVGAATIRAVGTAGSTGSSVADGRAAGIRFSTGVWHDPSRTVIRVA